MGRAKVCELFKFEITSISRLNNNLMDKVKAPVYLGLTDNPSSTSLCSTLTERGIHIIAASLKEM